MKLLILGTKDPRHNDDYEYYREYETFFRDAVGGDTSFDIKSALITDLLIVIANQITIQDTHNDEPLEAYTAVFLRGHGFMDWQDVLGVVTDYAHAHDIKMFNEYAAIRRISKLLQTAQMHQNGLPVPYTVFLNDAALRMRDALNLTLPFIMKAVDGSLGHGNHLIREWSELETIAAAHPKSRYILQEFIPNDGDYRLFFMGDKLLPIYRQAVEGSHLNNTSQGAAATYVDPREIPGDVIEHSKRIMAFYGMGMAGVDAMQHNETGDYYFLEVNAQPQLINGAMVDKKQAVLGDFLRSLQ